MPLKYQNELIKIHSANCPNSAKFIPRDQKGFRFVNHTATSVDFLPVAKKQGPATDCSHWALSFFTTLSDAKKKYSTLKGKPNYQKRYGTHIGEIDVVKQDGVSSLPSSGSGHFDLHEEHSTSFVGRVNVYHNP
jgi:hypothetical protein